MDEDFSSFYGGNVEDNPTMGRGFDTVADFSSVDLSQFIYAGGDDVHSEGSHTDAISLNESLNYMVEGGDPPAYRDSPTPDSIVPITFSTNGSEQQRKIINYTMHTLAHGKNLLIECPPGHQRRAVILGAACDFLEWSRHQEEQNEVNDFDVDLASASKPERIIFATQNTLETESLIQEIRGILCSSNILQNIKMCVLDHRKSYCVNDEVRSSLNVSNDCCNLVRNRHLNQHMQDGSVREVEVLPECQFYNTSSNFSFIQMTPNEPEPCTIRDIEDFTSECRVSRTCPFYASLKNVVDADLIICPQEFILSPVLREEYELDIDRAIIIFDEGCSLDLDSCKEASVQLFVTDLNSITRMLRNLLMEPSTSTTPELIPIITQIKNVTSALSKLLQREENESSSDPENNQNVGEDAFHFDPEAEILKELLSLKFSKTCVAPVTSRVRTHLKNSSTSALNYEGLQKFFKFLHLLSFLADGEGEVNEKKNFSIQVGKRSVGSRRTENIVKIVCSNPSLIFQPVEEASTSIIVGGSCLAPFYVFEDTNKFGLGVEFQAPTKISHTDFRVSERMLYCTCERGPLNNSFQLNFNSRQHTTVQNEIILGLSQICKTIPDGILIIFHSEAFLKEMLSRKIGKHDLLDTLKEHKHVFCTQDVRTEADIAIKIEAYRDRAKNPEPEKSGAVLVTHRGKVNQTLSLQGVEIRAVVSIGLPYRGWYNDENVLAKREHFSSQYGPEPYEFLEWYRANANHRMNQSFAQVFDGGRDDWGLVIVLDSRLFPRDQFDKEEELIPSWVQLNQDHFEGQNCFEGMVQRIVEMVQTCSASR